MGFTRVVSRTQQDFRNNYAENQDKVKQQQFDANSSAPCLHPEPCILLYSSHLRNRVTPVCQAALMRVRNSFHKRKGDTKQDYSA